MRDIQRRQVWRLWNELVIDQTKSTDEIIRFIVMHMVISKSDVIELLLITEREEKENGRESPNHVYS